jgi:hypothetical protein
MINRVAKVLSKGTSTSSFYILSWQLDRHNKYKTKNPYIIQLVLKEIIIFNQWSVTAYLKDLDYIIINIDIEIFNHNIWSYKIVLYIHMNAILYQTK